MIKYISYAITFAEIPDEVCLAIQITNCPFKCEGCHSPYLQEDIGEPLGYKLNSLIQEYKGRITCVCFMGDGPRGSYWELRSLSERCHIAGLKTAHYSGYENWDEYEKNIEDSFLCVKNGYKERRCKGNNTAEESCYSKELSKACYEMFSDVSYENDFNYVKLGSYNKDLGPLTSPTTNQRLWQRNIPCTAIEHKWTDITYKFWRN